MKTLLSLMLFILVIPIYSQSIFQNPTLNQVRPKGTGIKFKLVNNLMIIPAHINHSDTMWFILDTGVRKSIITELSTGDSLELNYVRKIQITGIGSGPSPDAFYSNNNHIRIGNIEGNHLELFVLDGSGINLSEKLGMIVHGLIGYDVFKDKVVKIDYSQQELWLYEKKDFKEKRTRKYTAIPIQIKNNRPFINGNILTKNNEWVNVNLLLDTGASLALWLSDHDNKQLQAVEPYLEGYLGRGLNGDIYGKKGRVLEFEMGGYRMKLPTVSYPDSNSVNTALHSDGRQGSLGGAIAYRMNWIIDYSEEKAYVRPNRFFKDDFNFDMSGMDITNALPGYSVFIISNIFDNSPAQEAGLKVGDHIIAINGQSIFDFTLNDLLILFQSKEGRKIRVKYYRDGEIIKTEFRLRKLV